MNEPMLHITRTAAVDQLILPRPRPGRDGLSRRMARRFVRTFVRWGSVTFFSRELTAAAPVVSGLNGFQVREAFVQDLDWLVDGANPVQPASHLRARFRRGDRCFVGVDPDGRAAHVRWVTTQRTFIPELDCDIVLQPGEVYFYDGYTRPEARGRGLDGLVRRSVFGTFAAQGCRRAWSYVRSDNPAGRRAAERWQAAAGSVRYFTLVGLHTFVRGDRAPGLPLLRRDEGNRTERTAAWRRWFEDWVDQPLPRRSTGFHAPPPEYFVSAASYIATTLELDAERDSVLDVGCDSAMVSRLLVDRCRQFTGVDFIAGMLADARAVSQPHTRRPLNFVASDGRRLPFRSASFSKVYCSAVIHTLPSREDGLAVVRELVRVCEPGGQVLVASIPDIRKRRAGRRVLLGRTTWWQRPLMFAYWMIPDAVKPVVKRMLGRPAQDPMAFLEYDLEAMAQEFEAAGHRTDVRDFPDDYWSGDFRTTRANLLITLRAPDASSRWMPR